MSKPAPELTLVNAIICDDIRDEAGNKKSLMGVLGGDIQVSSMPASIQLAVYLDMVRANKDVLTTLEIQLFIDDAKIAFFGAQITPTPTKFASLVIPKAVIQFEKDAVFSVRIVLADKTEIEAVQKKVSTVSA